MKAGIVTGSYPAAAVSALFAITLFYNGPGHSLHWLSMGLVVLLAWLALSIVRFDPTSSIVSFGWLPAIALAYFIWLLVSPWFSSYPYATWSAAMQLALLPLALLGWLLIPKKDKEAAWRLAWRSLICGGTILAAWGIYDYVFVGTRAHGPLIDANAYAALMNLFLLPAVAWFLSRPTSWQLRSPNDSAPLIIIASLAFAQAMSLSRGGLLAFIAVVPLLLWRCRTAVFTRRGFAVVLVFVLAQATIKLAPIDTSRGIDTFLQPPNQLLETDANLQARLKIWKSTWNIITESNPVVGTGLGTFKIYYLIYRDPTEQQSSGNLAHNDYLQALQEGGSIQLVFFLALAVFAPIRLLHQARQPGASRSNEESTSTGLLIGIVCLAVHGLVNFIQFVAPIALLTGLFLARAWDVGQPSRTFPTSPLRGVARMRPALFKAVAIGAITMPVCVVAIDGIIFKTFSGRDMQAPGFGTQQAAMLNTAITLRPSNPIPRTILIQTLIQAAGRAERDVARKELLDAAEAEAKDLVAGTPALAAGHYFLGTVRATKGTPADLLLARGDLERAVRKVPPATGVRLGLVRLYQRLGQEEQAYRSVVEAKKWVHLEKDYSSLAIFAHEAQAIAADQRDNTEAAYWAWIYGRLTELGFAS